MNNELFLIGVTAAAVGLIHTLLGPDHYLPFIVIAKARKWSLTKTAWVTFFAGVGHVGSSVVLGFVGIALGLAVTKLESLESWRGNLAGWMLIAFGLVYTVWGIRRAIRNRPHEHIHAHADGDVHRHLHGHHEEHVHVHETEGKANITPWVLFTIFVFGPCEPLIPLVMYPAAKVNLLGVAVVSLIFGVATIATMLTIVLAASKGLSFLPMKKLERYSHALAGATVLLCGFAIQFAGL